MKINLTIEEAKKALQKEAGKIRTRHGIGGDYLKASSGIKQMANGEFTIYSRDINRYRDVMLDLGNMYGNLVAIEKSSNPDRADGRIRFRFKNVEMPLRVVSNDICGKDVDELAEEEDHGKDTPVSILPMDALRTLIRVGAEVRAEQDLADYQIEVSRYVDFETPRNNAFVVTLIDTDFKSDQTRLTAFGRHGYLVSVRRVAENQTEYVFCLYTEEDKRAIKLDLREVVAPEAPQEATREPEASHPTERHASIAEAKKSLMKYAGKVRKQHNIPGSDFRIICSDYHISIGEFILFTKGNNYEYLLHEFEQYGVYYMTERAGADAIRYRFNYHKFN